MKKLLIVILILLLAAGGFGAYYYFSGKANERDIEEIKKGWHIEVESDYINIRKEASATADILGEVKKGEVYKVVDVETVGNTFDPELHEAVSSIQDENLGEKEIIEEYRKGYKIGNKVIRHSMVVVAN